MLHDLVGHLRMLTQAGGGSSSRTRVQSPIVGPTVRRQSLLQPLCGRRVMKATIYLHVRVCRCGRCFNRKQAGRGKLYAQWSDVDILSYSMFHVNERGLLILLPRPPGVALSVVNTGLSCMISGRHSIPYFPVYARRETMIILLFVQITAVAATRDISVQSVSMNSRICVPHTPMSG